MDAAAIISLVSAGHYLEEKTSAHAASSLRALLKLRLRRGSEAGLYRISVVDPNGKLLTGARARSRNGKSLEAVLDLRRAARTAHRLRVERGDDLNEYLIEIAKP